MKTVNSTSVGEQVKLNRRFSFSSTEIVPLSALKRSTVMSMSFLKRLRQKRCFKRKKEA